MDKKLSKGFEKSPLLVQMATAAVAGSNADLWTFPFDTIKVRAQLQGEKGGPPTGLITLMRHFVRDEGFFALYNGFAAGIQRQIAFSAIRLGIYDKIKTFYHNLFGVPESSINVPLRTLSGLTSGCIAVACAQPTDVVKIRFQAAAKIPGKKRYNTTRQAYAEILKNDGVLGLWQGVLANMLRNALCTIFNDGLHLHIITAIVAGFITTVVISPVDVVKTRYMNAPAGKYKGAVDCGRKTFAREGFFAFYKGFAPNVTRLVSWNLVMWVSYERCKIFVARYYNRLEAESNK